MNIKNLGTALKETIKNMYLGMTKKEQRLSMATKSVAISANPYELDEDERNKRLQQALEKKQIGDFILDNPNDYVFEEERITYEQSKENLFAENVAKKYQEVLDKVRKEEHLSKNDEKYTKFRNHLQQMQIIHQ